MNSEEAVLSMPGGVDRVTAVYRKIGDTELKIHIYRPSGWTKTDRRPAIVFFFGGGWVAGTPEQFRKQSAYLADRGMVAVTPEYRVKTRHGSTPFDSVDDAVSAVVWVRDHAGGLGIDPARIAVGGGSAGGHLAACTATLDHETAEGKRSFGIPAAMVLFNPVLDTSDRGFGSATLRERALEISPVHHLKPGVPPAIIFHGTDDTTVPFENPERFKKAMDGLGIPCDLVPYFGRRHAFFNARPGRAEDFLDTLEKADAFLTGLDFLKGNPRVREYFQKYAGDFADL